MSSPTIEIYNYVFRRLKNDYLLFDHPPQKNEKVTYPFVVMDEVQTMTQNYKTSVGLKATITLHVWGKTNMRQKVTDIVDNLSRLNMQQVRTEHYAWQGRINESEQQILTDTSVPNTVLKHGYLTLVFDLK